MRDWCWLPPDVIVPYGQFTEAALRTHSGRSLEDEDEFLALFAQRIMHRYEGTAYPSLLVLEGDLLDRPERSKLYYQRLIEENGDYTGDFVSWVGEVLAQWIEESLETTLCASDNDPHTNDPVYDVVVVLHDGNDELCLRLVQVKTTRDNLQKNCNEALDGFHRFERGEFLANLMLRLRWLKDTQRLPGGIEPRELLYNRERHFRVTAIHGEDRSTQRIMTTFDEKVSGGVHRRSARLVHIDDWERFWRRLADLIYAQLA